MNAPDKFSQLMRLTREPLPASRKIYVPGTQADIQVPMREIMQSNGEAVVVYDTSGPYTDPAAKIDVRQGLARCVAPGSNRVATPSLTPAARLFALDDGLKNGESETLAVLRAQASGLAAHAAPRQGGRQRVANALCPQRHHHPRDGIRGDPREPEAGLDGTVPGQRRARSALGRQQLWRQHPERS